jgi:hypothetical protein
MEMAHSPAGDRCAIADFCSPRPKLVATSSSMARKRTILTVRHRVRHKMRHLLSSLVQLYTLRLRQIFRSSPRMWHSRRSFLSMQEILLVRHTHSCHLTILVVTLATLDNLNESLKEKCVYPTLTYPSHHHLTFDQTPGKCVACTEKEAWERQDASASK